MLLRGELVSVYMALLPGLILVNQAIFDKHVKPTSSPFQVFPTDSFKLLPHFAIILVLNVVKVLVARTTTVLEIRMGEALASR